MSKSVRLSASAATTGSTKNTPMTSSAGATNHQAARSRLNAAPSAREHPAPLFEHVGRRARRAPPPPASTASSPCTDALGDQPHLGWRCAPTRGPWAPASRARAGRETRARRRRRRAPPSRHAARRGGRSPVSAWKRRCTSGRDRYSISCHAASLRRDARNTTRLEPPAIDAPGPSGPGQRRGHPVRLRARPAGGA